VTFPRISRQLAHEGGKVDRPNHRPPLSQGDIPGNYFCFKLSRTQGHIATLLGVESATLGLVAQCFHHCAIAYPYGRAEGEINLAWKHTTQNYWSKRACAKPTTPILSGREVWLMSSAAASSSPVKWVNCQSAAILKDLSCIRLLFKTAENTGKVLEKQSHITQFLCIRGPYYLSPTVSRVRNILTTTTKRTRRRYFKIDSHLKCFMGYLFLKS
jgi:hypothetical protein